MDKNNEMTRMKIEILRKEKHEQLKSFNNNDYLLFFSRK